MNTCIVCKKDTLNPPDFMGFVVCDKCDESSFIMEKMLEKGIKLEYADGSIQVLKKVADIYSEN